MPPRKKPAVAKKKAPKMGEPTPKTTKGRRRYSEEEKGTALAAIDANGGIVAHAARELGIPNTTLSEWAHGNFLHSAVTEVRRYG